MAQLCTPHAPSSRGTGWPNVMLRRPNGDELDRSSQDTKGENALMAASPQLDLRPGITEPVVFLISRREVEAGGVVPAKGVRAYRRGRLVLPGSDGFYGGRLQRRPARTHRCRLCSRVPGHAGTAERALAPGAVELGTTGRWREKPDVPADEFLQ